MPASPRTAQPRHRGSASPPSCRGVACALSTKPRAPVGIDRSRPGKQPVGHGQKNTGLSRSELRPVNAGQGYAMERAVREGDTGLHHTAKTRRCLLGTGPASLRQLILAAGWSVQRRVLSDGQRAFRCRWRPRPPPLVARRSAARLAAARRSSSSRIMPGLHGISTPAPQVFRQAVSGDGRGAAANRRWRQRPANVETRASCALAAS